MPRKKNRRKADPPPSPGGGAMYVLVQTKEGPYWRRKRGTVTKATLNDSLKKNTEEISLASPAAKKIRSRLEPFLRGLDTGRFIANVSGRLRKAMKETGEMDLTYMDNYDLQPWHPLENLMVGGYSVTEKNNEISIHIPIHKHTVKPLNKLVSDYYFEGILLWGDPTKSKGLKVESVISPLYEFGQEKKDCKLQLNLPTQKLPWMLILKISCHEGNEPAYHARHYGMKVVRVGKGR